MGKSCINLEWYLENDGISDKCCKENVWEQMVISDESGKIFLAEK